jgi:hypothetical protein
MSFSWKNLLRGIIVKIMVKIVGSKNTTGLLFQIQLNEICPSEVLNTRNYIYKITSDRKFKLFNARNYNVRLLIITSLNDGNAAAKFWPCKAVIPDTEQVWIIIWLYWRQLGTYIIFVCVCRNSSQCRSTWVRKASKTTGIWTRNIPKKILSLTWLSW